MPIWVARGFFIISNGTEVRHLKFLGIYQMFQNKKWQLSAASKLDGGRVKVLVCFSFLIGRISWSEGFCKKGVLKNIVKSTGKHLLEFLFNKAASLRPASLLKRKLGHSYFPVNLAKFLRTHFLQDTSDGCFFSRGENVVKVLTATTFLEKDCRSALLRRGFFHRLYDFF